jgi:hypothetical protein
MELNKRAYLVIEKGIPFKGGEKIFLKADFLCIGRSWDNQKPDIAFEDARISRRHAEIKYKEGRFEICDFSKHGTEVDGRPVTQGVPCTLEPDNKIVLARGAVVLRFCFIKDPGETQDIGDLLCDIADYKEKPLSPGNLVVDVDRREVLIAGQELRPRITGYEFELLVLLYRNRSKAVSHDEIVEWVWRDLPSRDTIMRQNVATLIHRLKERLGSYGENIANIPAFGYRLD